MAQKSRILPRVYNSIRIQNWTEIRDFSHGLDRFLYVGEKAVKLSVSTVLNIIFLMTSSWWKHHLRNVIAVCGRRRLTLFADAKKCKYRCYGQRAKSFACAKKKPPSTHSVLASQLRHARIEHLRHKILFFRCFQRISITSMTPSANGAYTMLCTTRYFRSNE